MCMILRIDFFADLFLLSFVVVAIKVCQIIVACFCSVHGDRDRYRVDGGRNLNLMLRMLFE